MAFGKTNNGISPERTGYERKNKDPDVWANSNSKKITRNTLLNIKYLYMITINDDLVKIYLIREQIRSLFWTSYWKNCPKTTQTTVNMQVRCLNPSLMGLLLFCIQLRSSISFHRKRESLSNSCRMTLWISTFKLYHSQ